MIGLHPFYMRSARAVERGLTVPCPVCREQPGKPCRLEDGKPVVHDARESIAYNGKRIWA